LKWPNDLMIEMKSGELKKVGGILVQRLDDYVVIGIGINVDLNEDELPTDNATSLSLIDIRTSREALIAAIIYELENTTGLVSREWLPMYFQDSSTIGTQVTVARRAESSITGIAMNVLESGELILETNDGLVEITSGDVI